MLWKIKLHTQNLKSDCVLRTKYNKTNITVWVYVVWKWKSLISDSLQLHGLQLTVHGIHQARILEWVAIPFSRGSSQPRNWTQVSCIEGRFFTIWATREIQEYWSGNLSLLQWIFPTYCLMEFIFTLPQLIRVHWHRTAGFSGRPSLLFTPDVPEPKLIPTSQLPSWSLWPCD